MEYSIVKPPKFKDIKQIFESDILSPEPMAQVANRFETCSNETLEANQAISPSASPGLTRKKPLETLNSEMKSKQN